MACWLGRSGYVDQTGGGGISLLDAFYYATVSITTTGYGDIVPVSDTARLLNTVIVTPARVLFLILLVGTTLEVLASHSRFLWRLRRYQRKLHDHAIVCGYGVKGRSAIDYLRGSGEAGEIVVIDTEKEAVDPAAADGHTAILGSGFDREVLRAAGIEQAATVLVAPENDDAAVLITLRARELNPKVRLVASCREEDNADLLKESGADSVIVSAEAAGRLIGLASRTPHSANVINDLLKSGTGLDLLERPVRAAEVGIVPDRSETFVAVIRGGKLLGLTAGEAGALREGDRVVFVKANGEVADEL